MATNPSHRLIARASTRIGFCLLLAAGFGYAAVQDFGQVSVGGGFASLTLSYSFNGLASAPKFSLTWNRDFQAASPSCTVGATTNCSILITFVPVSPGLRHDAVTVSDQSGNLLANTPLRGMGMSPLVALYPGIISTLAGNGTGGYQDSTNHVLAEFWNPEGVALDGSGNSLYVADSVNGVIRKIALSTGAVSTIAGNGTNGYSGDGGSATSAMLNTPTGVAVDGGGNLYIADQGNDLIRRVDAITHTITTVAGGATSPSGADGLGDGGPATNALLYGPQSVAVDSSGNLFVADTYHQLVRMVNLSTGIITVVAGGGTSAGTDSLGDGGPATSARLNNPQGVSLDSVGNLYIADTGDNLIRLVDMTTGVITAVAGNGNWGYSGDSGLATNATLASPQAVAVDAAGNIYVADYGNNAIRQISAASQKIVTLAGRGSTGYYGDGSDPAIAFLTSPSGVAVGENGNLYIADAGNNVVRQVSYAVWPLSLASEPVGALSPSQLVSPINIGNQTLNLSAVAIPNNFQQVSTGLSDCAAGTALSPGASCNLGLSFAPTVAGSLTGVATLTTNSLNNPSAVETIGLSGTALSGPGPQVSLSATSLSFSAQSIAKASAAQTVIMTNSGGAAFGISSVWVAGPQAGDFQISTTCGSSLAAAASCTVSVTFTPTGNATRSATLLFSDSVVGTPQSVALSGTGNGGVASLGGTTLIFPAVEVGATSSVQNVSFTNSGSFPLQLLSVTITGANASDFQVSSACLSTIPAGTSCSFGVTFAPSAAGTRTATLNIFDDSDDSPQTVTLTGAGTTGVVSSGPRLYPVWRSWYGNRRKTYSYRLPTRPSAHTSVPEATSRASNSSGMLSLWQEGVLWPLLPISNDDGTTPEAESDFEQQ